MMFLAWPKGLWRPCEVATIGIEWFGSHLDHATVGWKSPSIRLILTNPVAAMFEQKAGVVEASRLLVSPGGGRGGAEEENSVWTASRYPVGLDLYIHLRVSVRQ